MVSALLADGLCGGQVDGIGDLAVRCFAGDHLDGTSGPLDERGIVRSVEPRFVGTAQQPGAETLGRLHCNEGVPVDCASGAKPNAVRHIDRGYDGLGARLDGIDDPVEEPGGGQGSGGVVNENDVALIGNRSQTGSDRLGPRRTSGHRDQLGVERRRHTVVVEGVVRNDDHDAFRHSGRSDDGPLQHRNTFDLGELLATPEASPRPARHDDGPHSRALNWASICAEVGHVTIIAQEMVDTSLLTSVDLFRNVESEYIDALAESATERSLWRGDILFGEGDDPDALYIVISGRIAIANKSIDGRESVVALMEDGDLFGEMGLFDGMGRSAEARALEPSKVAEIPYDPVRATYEAHPELLWRVVDMLARRLRSMDEALADSVFLDVTGRTAKRLLELAGDADEFTLPITQEELSGMVGASRERVNKAISAFIRLGWLSQTDRRYTITNRKQLEIRSR